MIASWNGNTSKEYSERQIRKWRVKEPKLIRSLIGVNRLAKRGE